LGADLWSWCDDELVGRTSSVAGRVGSDPSGERLVTAHGQRAEVWDAATGELLANLNGSAPIEDVAIEDVAIEDVAIEAFGRAHVQAWCQARAMDSTWR